MNFILNAALFRIAIPIMFPKSYGISVGVFGISLLISWAAWQYTRHTVSLKEEAVFLQEAQEIEDVITYRLDDYIEALFGLRSLLATEEHLTRLQWNTYCDSLALPSRVPGILSLRFDTHVMASEQTAFLEIIRSDTTLISQGFPEFTISFGAAATQPQVPPNDDLYVVTYIWPWNHYKALYGVDVFSIPEQRIVIEQARDSGEPALSSKTRTNLDAHQHSPEFIIYLPVYHAGASLSTPEERRAAVAGMVAARFYAPAVIEHALSRVRRHPLIDVDVFDGTRPVAEHRYYTDGDALQTRESGAPPLYSRQKTIDMYGQSWTIVCSSKPGFRLETTEVLFPWIALGTGLAISVLLTGTVFSLTFSQIRATRDWRKR